MEVRGQVLGSSLSPHIGTGDRAQAIRLGSTHLSPLRHLTSPSCIIFILVSSRNDDTEWDQDLSLVFELAFGNLFTMLGCLGQL